MFFSVGILYSAQRFVRFVSELDQIDSSFSKIFDRFSLAKSKYVLQVSQDCRWVQFNVEGYLEVTYRGKEIIKSKTIEEALRIQLKHLIGTYSPAWSPLLSRGRTEAMTYLAPDVRQCFREADLLTSYNKDVIGFWDELSKVSRTNQDEVLLDIGRVGERQSLIYEQKRTKKEPLWQAVESNLSGYDILSTVDENDDRSLCIEVKTSNSKPRDASFHISRNEWCIAETVDHYIFHLWSLYPDPELFIVDVSTVRKNIPQEIGSGRWEKVRVPYAAVIPEIN